MLGMEDLSMSNLIYVEAAGLSLTFTTATFGRIASFMASGQKINAIKEMRTSFPSCGLKECKDFVEGAFGECPTLPPIISNVQKCQIGLGQYALLDTLGRTKERVKEALKAETVSERFAVLLDLYMELCNYRKDEANRISKYGLPF